MMTAASYKVLLLAGHRATNNEISGFYQVRYKALAPVAGQPMILHVLDSLENCKAISEIIVLSQEPEILKAALKDYNLADRIRFTRGSGSIAGTVLNYCEEQPVLVTTADNCLLTAGHINAFLEAAQASQADVYIGVVEKDNLLRHYPQSRRTWIRFSDTEITGCNLFLLNGRHARPVIEFWKTFETSPKKIAKLAFRLGPLVFWRFWRRHLSLAQAFAALDSITGAKITPIMMQSPEIAIDADKLSDIEQIEMILGYGTSSTAT